MLKINVQQSTERFMAKLRGGEYEVPTISNDEVVYSETKERRDTEAVEAFLSSELSNKIIELK
ncbi:MAG: hypothetical protein LBR85_07850 [Oscillospiraceae bacterium]|nr:hypothetical protein [Oscillospiraceae bacterium]